MQLEIASLEKIELTLEETRERWEIGLEEISSFKLGEVFPKEIIVVLKGSYNSYRIHRYWEATRRDWACSVDFESVNLEKILKALSKSLEA